MATISFELVRNWREAPRSLVEVNCDGDRAEVQIFCRLEEEQQLHRLVAQACRMVCGVSEALRDVVRNAKVCFVRVHPDDEQRLRTALKEANIAQDGPSEVATRAPPPSVPQWSATGSWSNFRPAPPPTSLSRGAGGGPGGHATFAAFGPPTAMDSNDETKLDSHEVSRILTVVEQVAREKSAYPDFESDKLKTKAYNYIRSVSGNHLLDDASTEAIRQQLAVRLRET